MICFE